MHFRSRRHRDAEATQQARLAAAVKKAETSAQRLRPPSRGRMRSPLQLRQDGGSATADVAAAAAAAGAPGDWCPTALQLAPKTGGKKVQKKKKKKQQHAAKQAAQQQQAAEAALQLAQNSREQQQLDSIYGVIRQALRGQQPRGGSSGGGQTVIRNVSAAFSAADRDGSGRIDRREFEAVVARLGLGLTAQQVGDLIDAIDADDDGGIEYGEFVGAVGAKEEEGSDGRRRRKKSPPTMKKNDAAEPGSGGAVVVSQPTPPVVAVRDSDGSAAAAQVALEQLKAETGRKLASARGEVAQHKESTLALASCVEDTVAENMRLSGEVAKLQVELALLRGRFKEHERLQAQQAVGGRTSSIKQDGTEAVAAAAAAAAVTAEAAEIEKQVQENTMVEIMVRF